MNYYRIFFLDHAGRVFRAQDCEAVDDLAALDIAMPLSKGYPIEIWQGKRYVAKLAKGGEADPLDCQAQRSANR